MLLRTLAALLLVTAPSAAFPYSILTHEAVIDAVWETDLVPALLARDPHLGELELLRARAHAYGGSLIQDLGYYPSSNRLFTDLTHYVRSGAFVQALLAEARDANEYAFALGALAHYTSDLVGHPRATNLAVAIYSPKLERKYGSFVAFEESPTAHIRAEFGFDVVQAAQGRFAPKAYHDFVGFEVAKGVLERAFAKTYGLDLATLLGDEDRTINTYRHTASELFPKLTEIAWLTRKDDIREVAVDARQETFVYRFGRAEFEKEFGAGYARPSLGKRILAFLYRLVPKIGPLKMLAFKVVTPETESLFLASLEETIAGYRFFLERAALGTLTLPDYDLDTGKPVGWGESRITALTYARLLEELSTTGYTSVPQPMRNDILVYFEAGGGAAPPDVKDKEWRKTLALLERLRSVE